MYMATVIVSTKLPHHSMSLGSASQHDPLFSVLPLLLYACPLLQAMSRSSSHIVVAARPSPPVRRQAMASLLLGKVSGSVPRRTTRTPPHRPTTMPCELRRCSPMCVAALFASPPLLVRCGLPPHLPFLSSLPPVSFSTSMLQ